MAHLVGMFKIGSQLFAAAGPKAVEKLGNLGPGIFLDLKFHDIPNTVTGAVSAAAALPGVRLLTVHTLGGREMLHAAVRAAAKANRRPKLLGVTLLTSLDGRALRQIGLGGSAERQVVKLARLALEAGLDGVVASAGEARAIRRACGDKFLIVVPGVRPARSGPARTKDDQARVATPAEAIRAGADYIVVGRPITAARDPAAAAAAIIGEMPRPSNV